MEYDLYFMKVFDYVCYISFLVYFAALFGIQMNELCNWNWLFLLIIITPDGPVETKSIQWIFIYLFVVVDNFH